MMIDKYVCIICNAHVTLSKKANVERYFRTVHKNFEDKYSSGTALRKSTVQQLTH